MYVHAFNYQNDSYVYVQPMTGYKLSQYNIVINTKFTALMHGKQCYVS